MVIVELVEGGGAQLAGLVVGDGIVEIDGKRVTDLGIQGALERIRGPAGTAVLLAVRRVNSAALRDIAVERRAFRYGSTR